MMREQKILIALLVLLIGTYAAVYGVIPFFTKSTYNHDALIPIAQKAAATSSLKELPVVAHIATPAAVKTIYMSSCVAGTKQFRQDLVDIIDTTEINSVIIDIKDFTGYLSYRPENPALTQFMSPKCRAPDMKQFIETLHAKGIYVIGRITVFQDPLYTKKFPEYAVRRESDNGIWADRKGINYLDPGAKPVWEYTVSIAKDAYNIGFDELNFDYIRFPSDGNMQDIAFPHSVGRQKQLVLEDFFNYLHAQMKPTGAKISADLFGMTTTTYVDLNIGQILERALPYFDYVAPMVYPSHYPPQFNGWSDPNKYPYEVIKYTMDAAVARTIATSSRFKLLDSVLIGSTSPQRFTKQSYDKNKVRPWLQDFDYGGNYDIAEVRAQIQATYDAGLNSWMLWAPSNRYTVGALNKD